MKVFLDTNIIIQGDRKPSHNNVKQLCRSGRVELFYSQEVLAEQQKRSLNHYFNERNIALKKYSQKQNSENLEHLKATLRNQKKLKISEKQEMVYWSDVKLKPLSCTFEGLLWFTVGGTSPTELLSLDIKNEIPKLGELFLSYNIEPRDALHIMMAHSAKLDILLTWDNTLINKAARVSWLYPKVMKPDQFLRKFKI